jgi:YHS domain-containing protein
MEKKTSERDPVCKMKIRDDYTIRSTYKGKEYHFCSDDCRKAFEMAPEKYVDKEEQV